jgi:hypothetical protein
MIEGIRGSQPDAVIIVGGDMNAKVGNQTGLSTSAVSKINTHNQTATYTISTDTSQQLSETDARGLLCELCIATDLVNLTGLTTDDSPAPASFISQSNQQGSEPGKS